MPMYGWTSPLDPTGVMTKRVLGKWKSGKVEKLKSGKVSVKSARAMTKLSTIGQIAMVVKDLPRAVAFYRDVLGMKFLFQAPPALAFFDCGGVRLMLDAAAEGEFNRPGSILYYKVDDIGGVHTDLQGKGV